MRYLRRMKWQDMVFSLGEIVFMIGLLPSVFGHQKPAPITSLVTGLMLLGLLVVHASYKLWHAFALCALTAGLWFTLFAQAIT